jgi:hypothetical protein
MVEFTIKEADKLQELVDAAIDHAKMGSRTAWKALLAIKPRVDCGIESISRKSNQE